MSARYYFDVRKGQDVIRDEDGIPAEDLIQAIEQTVLAVQEMRESGELEGSEGWTLVIRNADEQELRRVAIEATRNFAAPALFPLS